MSSKREREYERRRLEKWQQRQARARAERHRRNIIVGSVVAAAVVISSVAIAVAWSSDSPTASPTPTSAIDTSPRTGNGGVLPAAALAEGRTWTGTIATDRGDIEIELDGAAAPQAVANFVTLAAEGYFDETKCHRLVTTTIHILQCGDPTASGNGGPGYSWGPIENPPSDDVYAAGTIAMARVGNQPESMGSQFFLVYADSTIPSDSAGGYTVFGKVTSGLDVLQAIADAGVTVVGNDTAPVSDVIIERVETQ